MKKILLFIFVIAFAFSCIVVPFAFADDVVTEDTSTTSYSFSATLDMPFLLTTSISPFPSLSMENANFNSFVFGSLSFTLSIDSSTSLPKIVFGQTASNTSGVLTNLAWSSFDFDSSSIGSLSDIDFLSNYSTVDSLGTLYRTDSSTNGTNIIYDTESQRFIYCEASNNFTTHALFIPLVTSYGGTGAFNCNVLSRSTYYDSSLFSNIIRYYDNNNNYVQLRFPVLTTNLGTWVSYWSSIYGNTYSLFEFIKIESTTRYYNNVLTDSEQYNIGKNEGYLLGFEEGQDKGFIAGEIAGFENGDIVGYNRGYREGTEAAGTYTFTSLISAVFDAPIQAFRGLLDFNLLGVDMAQFVLSLFSLSLIIVVVRFMLAR